MELKDKIMRVALFAGSFNPFTKGHLRIVERTLKFSDKVIIAIGQNIAKAANSAEMEKRIDTIRKGTAGLGSKVEVRTYTGLTAEFARQTGASFLVRGVRGEADFDYERNLADINLKVLGMETVILISEPEFSYISSSSVRELAAHGYDVSSFLP